MPVSRRALFALVGGLATVLSLTACGGGGETASAPAASASSSASSGAWKFTDDRGKTIELPSTPTRVVAQVGSAAALWDFGIRPVGVFGPHKLPDGSKDPQVGNVDITQVTGLGNVWDEFNVEQYISLKPDLLVSGMYEEGVLWYVPEKSKDAIEQVAPTVGIMLTGKSATQVIERYAELAQSLGADLNAPEVTQAKARFEAATEELKKIGATGLKVLMMSGGPDTMWVVNPPMYPDILHLTQNGLQVITPDKIDEGGFWESLSWENADKYEADVILYDARTQALTLEDMKKKPTFAKLPAVQAGQVYPWRAETPFSYQGYADFLEELVNNLKQAKKLT